MSIITTSTGSRRNSRNSSRWSIVALLSLFGVVNALACVSSGKYEEMEAERDELEQQVGSLQAAEQRLAQDVEAKDQQIAQMMAQQERLSGELETEVAMRQVDVQRLADGIRLNVSDQLLFPSGSAELDARGRKVLARIAGELDPARQIISVVGHSDAYMLPGKLRDQFATNWELAASRAAIVVRALSEAGVPPTSLRAVSRGPFDPVASNDTARGRALNRRTEIIVRQDPSKQ
jgi:chemotaxis protein MotB